MPSYRHRVKITKTTTTGGGFGEDPTTSVVTRYDGRADVQDLSYEVKRSLDGGSELMGDARLFFPRNLFPAALIDDEVEVRFEGVTLNGAVVDIDRLDKTLVVKWL